MKKNFLVSAYTFYNVGDDLFIQILCERYPAVHFYIVAPKDYKKIFNIQKNLHIIPSDNFFYRIINKIITLIDPKNSLFIELSRFMDAIIIIGGSMFIENSDWQKRFEISNKKFFKKKDKFIIGANFGPYKTKEFYETFKEAFYNYNDICFRDSFSFKLFEDLPIVRKANDIVFTFQNMKSYDKEDEISISVINLKNRDSLSKFYEDYLNQLKNVTSFFINKGITVNLISFCDAEGDLESATYIYNLLTKLEKQKCNVINYKYNLNEVIKTLQKSRLIIASRFHAMILGWKFKSVVIPLIYSDKMINVINDSKFFGYYKRIEDINELDIQQIYEEYLKNNIFEIELLEIGAQKQFSKLDEYLQEEKSGK